MYIVVTGLRLKSALYQPIFMFHAMRSFHQASQDPANLHTDATTIDGVHHTITAWTSAEATRAYGVTGAHKRASAVFSKIATGQVFKGELTDIPTWEEARILWETKGVPV